jgi:hypothetical protein
MIITKVSFSLHASIVRFRNNCASSRLAFDHRKNRPHRFSKYSLANPATPLAIIAIYNGSEPPGWISDIIRDRFHNSLLK